VRQVYAGYVIGHYLKARVQDMFLFTLCHCNLECA